jgi:tetratricopeptide (TPR) repeat protein
MEKTTSQILLPGIQEAINSIANNINAGQTIIFCGAGISRDSGFPVVNEFVPYALLTLYTSIEEIPAIESSLKTIADTQQRYVRMKQLIADRMEVSFETIDKIINNLPFEAFVEILHDNSEIDEILKIYDARAYEPHVKPNTNHVLLAKLIAIGKVRTIVTTNFDQLIEKSLEQQGQQAGRDFDVVYREEDFDRIDWSQDRCRLIKIHGTADDKQDMVDITLSQIAREELSAARANIIRHIFSKGTHQQVLVLGYSCSDQFDLSPQIQSLPESLKRVCLAQHSDITKIEDIRKQKEKNPFKVFNNSTRLFFNTNHLIELLWKVTLEETYPDTSMDPKTLHSPPDWKAKVHTWYMESTKARSESIKDIISGRLFSSVCEWQAAIRKYKSVLTYARVNKMEQIEQLALGNMGAAYNSLSKYRKAIALLTQALEIVRHLKDLQGEIRVLNSMGLAYLGLDEYEKAIGLFEKVLEIDRHIEDALGEGKALNNIGLAYIKLGKYCNAIGLFEQAREIAHRVGDVQGIRNAFGNLGIAYNNLGEYRKALELCNQSLKIDRHIGDPQGESRDLNTLGGVHLGLGEFSRAIERFEQYLEIARRIGDLLGECDALGNLGVAQMRLGAYLKAIGFFEQSKEIAHRVSHPQNEGNALHNMGRAYSLMGDKEKAAQAFVQSKAIFTMLRLPNMVNYVEETMKQARL